MTTTRRALTVPVTAEVAGRFARGAVVSNQLHVAVEQAVVAVLGSSPADAERARAYCGPAHGHTWLLEGESSWPPRIMLVGRDGPHEYRLVHDLRAHRPARDHLGNTFYLAVLPSRARDERSTTA